MAHGDFKMHLDTTKQAVESAKTEILEGVRKGVEEKLVGAVERWQMRFRLTRRAMGQRPYLRHWKRL